MGADLKSRISDLIALAESCARQLRGWADHLQNADIRGQRHLNEQTRHAYEAKQRAAAFWDKLEEQQRKRVEEWSRRSSPASPDQEPESRERL